MSTTSIRRIKVTISLDELTALKNRIAFLEKRLAEYEPPQKEIKLPNRNGKPPHPLRKRGSKSILEELPVHFSEEEMRRAYEAANLRGNYKDLLRVWRNRGYIFPYDNDGWWKKSQKYCDKLKQGKLIRPEY